MKTFYITLLMLLPMLHVSAGVLTDPPMSDRDSIVACTEGSSNEAALNTRHQIIGMWQYELTPAEAVNTHLNTAQQHPGAGAFLAFDFHTDGTYTRTLGSASQQRVERGDWMVCATGDLIVLLPEDSHAPRTLSIDYLQMDELVLHTEMKELDNSLFFNKM